MSRSRVLIVVAGSLLLASGCAGRMSRTASAGRPFNVVETGIPELQKALANGRITSRQLVLGLRFHRWERNRPVRHRRKLTR